MDISVDKLARAANQVASNVGTSIADGVDQLVSYGSNSIEKLSSVISVRGVPPPPPEPFMRRNKGAILVALGAIGAAALIFWLPRKKRRVCGSRVADGGRQDVVLVVGSPSEPLVRLIVQDLNYRSFIVYVSCATEAESKVVEQEHCEDIRALPLNPMDPANVAEACDKMSSVLSTSVTTLKGSTPYFLNLVGILIVPDLSYPQGPLEMVSQQDLETCIASKIVAPLFVLRCGLIDLARQHNSRLVLLNPSIIGSLCPPFHVTESMFTAAQNQMALTLHRELRSQGIPFCQIKLGSFDVASDFSGHQRQVVNNMRADMLAWPEKVRHLYAGSYLSSSYLQTNHAKGSSLDDLHSTIADTLTARRPRRIVHTGRYGSAYELLRDHVPEFAFTWLLS